MTFNELISQIQQLAEIIGPNRYLQAIIIAITFIFIGKIADWIISNIIGRFARRSLSDFDDQLISIIHRPIFLSFIFLGLTLGTHKLNLPILTTFITVGVLKTLTIFVWYGTLLGFTDLVVNFFSKTSNQKIVQTGMLSLLHNAIKIVIAALAIYFFFLAWNINVTAWLASAGIVGLALSFAAKDTLSNLFAGVSIIIDAPYKAGDFIILETGERGLVTDIGLRSTRILTRDDIEITIPNGIIGNSKIINEAGGPKTQHRIRASVGIAYGSNLDEVIKVLKSVATKNPEILESPEPRVRFRSFGDSSLNFELLGWIEQPVNRGRITHELNCSIYKTLNKNKISIPFPQRDLYLHTINKDY
tara:strand:- start:7041 stop:8120 length:1080 start_codon:yes stop_codon:yes gene_type:complete